MRFQVGCGAGNTLFPLLDATRDPGLFVYACDFSASAVEIVRGHDRYDTSRSHAFVFDLANDQLELPDQSIDVVVCIFVLSALHPDDWSAAIKKLVRVLKPGGKLLLRDYGRHDLAQLRFKAGRYISDNFYQRGEGTQVYFFEQHEMRGLMEGEGLVELQNRFDRRLIVNRKTQQQMHRVWLQCKYRKPQ